MQVDKNSNIYTGAVKIAVKISTIFFYRSGEMLSLPDNIRCLVLFFWG